jgi:hypothetical protein
LGVSRSNAGAQVFDAAPVDETHGRPQQSTSEEQFVPTYANSATISLRPRLTGLRHKQVSAEPKMALETALDEDAGLGACPLEVFEILAVRFRVQCEAVTFPRRLFITVTIRQVLLTRMTAAMLSMTIPAIGIFGESRSPAGWTCAPASFTANCPT